MAIVSTTPGYPRFDTPPGHLIYACRWRATTPWRGALLAPLPLPPSPGEFAKAQGPPSKTTTSRNWSRECQSRSVRRRSGSGFRGVSTAAFFPGRDPLDYALIRRAAQGRAISCAPYGTPCGDHYRGGCRAGYRAARGISRTLLCALIYRPINSIAGAPRAKRPYGSRPEPIVGKGCAIGRANGAAQEMAASCPFCGHHD